MKIRHQITDIRTGKSTEEWFDSPDVLTPDQGLEQDKRNAMAEQNVAIKAELAANDVAIVRALLEGDTARIEAHRKRQAGLRSQLSEQSAKG